MRCLSDTVRQGESDHNESELLGVRSADASRQAHIERSVAPVLWWRDFAIGRVNAQMVGYNIANTVTLVFKMTKEGSLELRVLELVKHICPSLFLLPRG